MTTPARVIVVDDDASIRDAIADCLLLHGYQVRVAADAAALDVLLQVERPDLIVLDWMMPGEDGLSVCRRLQARAIPILMLSAMGSAPDRVIGLEMGADDYVCKPVRPRVLLARIRALLRRSEGGLSEPVEENVRRLEFGPLVIDNAMREAWLNERSIELTSAEFDLLWLLAANAGRILSREEIFNALRGIEYDGQDRSIDVRISRIRPKIGDDPMHPRLIKTVRSKGYLFVREAAEGLL